MVIVFISSILLFGIFSIWYYTRDTQIVRVKKGQIVDFTHSMAQSGLPVLTFYQNKKTFNFLMDTGSNASYINADSGIEVSKSDLKNTYLGADGINHTVDTATIKIGLNNTSYECPVSIADLKASFTDIKNSYGINLHGIIGTDFMNKYSYCIDFKELVVYARK